MISYNFNNLKISTVFFDDSAVSVYDGIEKLVKVIMDNNTYTISICDDVNNFSLKIKSHADCKYFNVIGGNITTDISDSWQSPTDSGWVFVASVDLIVIHIFFDCEKIYEVIISDNKFKSDYVF